MEKKASDPVSEKASAAEARGLLVKAAPKPEKKVEISGGMKVSEVGKEKALSSYSRPMKLGFVGEQSAPPKLELPKTEQPLKREVPVRKILESKVQTTAPINASPYSFGGIPNSSVLRPKGHSRIDTAVRILRKTKKYLEIISNYGILHLIPLEDSLIRVQFQKGIRAEFEPGLPGLPAGKPCEVVRKRGQESGRAHDREAHGADRQEDGGSHFSGQDWKMPAGRESHSSPANGVQHHF